MTDLLTSPILDEYRKEWNAKLPTQFGTSRDKTLPSLGDDARGAESLSEDV